MPLIVKDRVQETSATTGTGTLTLSGAVTGFQTFSSAIGNTNTTYYAIQNNGTNEWEVGIGTVSAGALSRDTVLESSNSGSLVNFSAGVKNVFCTYPAEKSVDSDTSQTVSNKDITGGSIENSPIGATTASTGRFTSVTTPTVTATTNDLTLSAISTGLVKFNTLNGTQVQIENVGDGARPLQMNGGSAGGVTSAGIGASSGSLQISTNGRETSFYSGGRGNTEQARIAHTASAVNFVQVTGSATGAPASALGGLSFTGSDASPNFAIGTKGTGYVAFYGGAATNNQAFRISTINATGAGNLLQVQAASAGSTPTISAISGASGTDANISMAFQPKGTGAINLAAGSQGVNISNGGTVTAITRTASGANYTSIPSCVISAPTTAGGVQATVSLVMAAQSGTAVTPANGGTGYSLNDVLTVVGGTFAQVAQFTVTGVSAGVVTQVTRNNTTNFGNYTVLPTSPAATTGGTGTGCTLNMRWEVVTFTITNAGSGYVEQPTVTFSGGGGSGAAAYASVGSEATFRTLGTTLRITTPAGEQLRVSDSGNSTLDYVQVSGGFSPFIATGGASANSNLSISSRGTGTLFFRTNGVNQVQMQVTHTASAVNFVQVTGGATTGAPVISAQGSDANIPLTLRSKGVFNINLTNGAGNAGLVVNMTSGATLANYVEVAPKIAGQPPVISALGTDTNIDLTLTPKGTGVVQFGTYTATVTAVAGFIQIRDAGGTLRKLAVLA